jgi:hypothetical protein
MNRFLLGQLVFFGKTSGEVREALAGDRYIVREGFTWALHTVAGGDMIRAAHSVGGPSWVDMTPLERATRWAGRCCDCGAVLPLAMRATALRCDEHERAYKAATKRVA